LDENLLLDSLFGHVKGAFTEAHGDRKGAFLASDGGTLFLDEIGDMPADTQTRLLRVLADGEFYRVGGHVPVKVDVRIIAATHQNLENLVQRGAFREDLFHRLNVIRIHIPKLAERREDIPRLMKYFFQQAAKELGGETKVLLPEAEAFLCSLDWPGNVRQLENCCRWITVMASGREVHLSDLPPELGTGSTRPATSEKVDWPELLFSWARNELVQGKQQILQQAVPTFEKVMIQVALQHSQGRKRDAADLLGWGRNTLTRKMKDLEL
jgi:two-component system nitrogen regulation response regulator GlnG